MTATGALAVVIALALNAAAIALGLDYLWSVLVVFGGMALFFAVNGARCLRRDDWKLFAGFVVFSNASTLGIEIVMMRLDVWGFTRRVHPLVGITFLGAPIEEYVYWALCPVIVGLGYMVFSRRAGAGGAPIPVEPLLLARLARYAQDLRLRSARDEVDYVDAAEAGKDGRFSRGKRFPVYIFVQIAIVGAILAMARFYRGSWRSMAWTTGVFFLVAFPNELYSLHNGYWIYNAERMIGVSLLDIPAEGWAMYFIAPVCASMMLDISSRKIFGQDL